MFPVYSDISLKQKIQAKKNPFFIRRENLQVEQTIHTLFTLYSLSYFFRYQN